MTTHTLNIVVAVLFVSCASRFVPPAKQRQWLLLGASYALYAHLAGLGFLALLVASSLMNYLWGALLRRRPTIAILWTAIGANVLLLAFFKYVPAVANAWPGAFSGVEWVQRIVLPLGVSFWTFQALSYLFDTYLEEELDPSVVEFCLYMAFWPTVAAGPVCRLPRMLPQFRAVLSPFRTDFPIGVVRVIQGLFMKVVLAQLLAAGVTPGGGVTGGFNAVGVERSGLDVWALAIGFGFQLFFDFAGYSHIVIGAARLFGFRLEENFNRPYLSTTPVVFWTRWHMSLSFWIRDYLYTPLATLRRKQWWRYAALVISMLIFGLWHDAKVTLILWGTYHGLVLVGYRVGQQFRKRVPLRLPYPIGALLSWAATFLLMCLAYVFFRANSLSQCMQMLRAVISPGSYGIADSTLPREYFVLVGLMVGGYFAFVGGTWLLMAWTSYCARSLKRARSTPTQSVGVWRRLGHIAMWITEIIAVRRRWLLAPALILLLGVTALSFLVQSAEISPFIYMLF